MDFATGKDASADVDRLLGGIRRLTALADGAMEGEAVFRALAGELVELPGAEEVQLHVLARPGQLDDLVVVYMPGENGRLSYLQPRDERPPGVRWVARTGRSFLAAAAEELEATVPELAAAPDIGSVLLLPLSERGEVGAVAVLVRRRPDPFGAEALELGGALVEQAATALALVRARAEAGTDAVTGSLNHRAMRRRLDEEIGRATRTGSPLSCLLIDLDNFKLVNDHHGHQAGDAALRAVVQALVGEFRAFDRVARYGGDEFVVILPNAGLDSAAAAASRALDTLRTLVAGAEIGGEISASVGVAEWQAPMGTDDLLEACDAALLRSKREGKGRVTRAEELPR
jgi:diguanylate cyclase (GGDEF)-like protein